MKISKYFIVLSVFALAYGALGQEAALVDHGCSGGENPRFRVADDEAPPGIKTPLCIEQTEVAETADGFDPPKPRVFLPKECTLSHLYRCDKIPENDIGEGYEVWCVQGHNTFFRTVVRAH